MGFDMERLKTGRFRIRLARFVSGGPVVPQDSRSDDSTIFGSAETGISAATSATKLRESDVLAGLIGDNGFGAARDFAIL